MNKKVTILVIFIGILLIGGGVVLTLFPTETKKATEETNNNKQEGSLPAEIVETRNYQQVAQVPANTITQVAANESGFIQLSKTVGFSSNKCEEIKEGNENFIACTADNIAYKDQLHVDHLNVAYLNGTKGIYFNMMLNFYEPHYTVDKVMQTTNTVLGNYFGTPFTREQIQENVDGIKNNLDEAIFAKEYTVGDYTVEFSTQYQNINKLYIVMVRVAPKDRFESILKTWYNE